MVLEGPRLAPHQGGDPDVQHMARGQRPLPRHPLDRADDDPQLLLELPHQRLRRGLTRLHLPAGQLPPAREFGRRGPPGRQQPPLAQQRPADDDRPAHADAVLGAGTRSIK